MAAHGGVSPPTAPANELDEEGHYFDFSSFYKEPQFCDRVFRLENESTQGSLHVDEENEEISVNSIVVAAKSAVLRAMLSNGMKESDKSTPVPIKVTKEERTAFHEMLSFFYSGDLSARFQDPKAELRELIDLLILGDKYQAPSFMGAVLKYITKKERTLMDTGEIVDHLPDVLEQRPQIKAVAEAARAHVLETFKDVSATWHVPMFLKLSVVVLEFLLKSEELEAESEEEVARGVLLWAEGDPGRVRKMVPHIRLCCMRGETLEKWLCEEAFGPEGSTLIRNAIQFLAYSDEKKQAVTDVIICPRKGIRDVHLELVENVFLKENGDKVETASALWFGRHWYLQIAKVRGNDPPSVGVYLCCKESSKEAESIEDKVKVEYRFYARTWPDGFWMLLQKTVSATFYFQTGKEHGNGWGNSNALGVPWEEARRLERFNGPTGALTVRVVARRLGSSEE